MDKWDEDIAIATSLHFNELNVQESSETNATTQTSSVDHEEEMQFDEEAPFKSQYVQTKTKKSIFPQAHLALKFTTFTAPRYPYEDSGIEDCKEIINGRMVDKATQASIINISKSPNQLRTLHNESGVILTAKEPYYLWPFTSLLAEEVDRGVIEKHAVDAVNFNGIPIAVVCPICDSITCEGPSRHGSTVPPQLTTIANLPVELFDRILSFFTIKELYKHISPVCRSWRYLGHNCGSWKHLDMCDYSTLSTAWMNFLMKRHGHLVKSLKLHDRKLSLIDVSVWSRHLTGLEGFDYKAYACRDVRFQVYKLLLASSPHIKSLMLTGDTRIHLHHMRMICKWPLTSIHLVQCKRVDMNTLIYMVKHLSTIKHIDLRAGLPIMDCVVKALCGHHATHLTSLGCNSKKLTDNSISLLPQAYHLHTLCLEMAIKLTNKSIASIAKLHNLRQLHISHACKMSSNALGKLFEDDNLSELQSLVLCSGVKVTDQVVKAIVRSCGATLTFLDLSDTLITDIGLALIIYNCRHLTRLCLDANKNVCGDNLLEVHEHLPNLSVLEMRSCPELNRAAAYQLREKMPSLSIRSHPQIMKVHKIKLPA